MSKGIRYGRRNRSGRAIFDRWARALYRGEIVETPLGEMQAVKALEVVAPLPRVIFETLELKHLHTELKFAGQYAQPEKP